jgi:hypothetical protein
MRRGRRRGQAIVTPGIARSFVHTHAPKFV